MAQALKDPLWGKDMEEEVHALYNLGTWELVPPVSTQNIFKCKWVYHIKYKSDGTIDRYKACLVAKRFQQRCGSDYTETFSPVVKPVTIRTLLSLTVTNNWHLRQLDINNTFLQGTLYDKFYMCRPHRFDNAEFLIHVCKLR